MDVNQLARTTLLLKDARNGNSRSREELSSSLYGELRNLAAAYFRNERPGHTLQPTALVHETYLRLIDQSNSDWKDRAHFLGIAARIMRQVLVDHFRQRHAKKRGGELSRKYLYEDVASPSSHRIEILDLEEALTALQELDERKARVVELRFYSGLTYKECAEVLGISPKTVEDDWYFTRAWLREKLDTR